MITAAMAKPNQTQLQPNKATAKRSAEAFFLPFIIKAILPITNSINSSFINPIQKTILDFHSNFNKIGNTVFTTLKLTPVLKSENKLMAIPVPSKI